MWLSALWAALYALSISITALPARILVSNGPIFRSAFAPLAALALMLQ